MSWDYWVDEDGVSHAEWIPPKKKVELEPHPSIYEKRAHKRHEEYLKKRAKK